jgi:hypothetical protein
MDACIEFLLVQSSIYFNRLMTGGMNVLFFRVFFLKKEEKKNGE